MEEIIITKAKVDRKRPWLSVREHCIYIPNTYNRFEDYKSYKLIEQWDKEQEVYNSFIMFNSEELINSIKVQKDGFGRIKIKLSKTDNIFNYIKCNINIELIEVATMLNADWAGDTYIITW